MIFSENKIKNVKFIENYKATGDVGYTTLESAKKSFENYISKYKNVSTFNAIKKIDEKQEYYYEYSFDFTNMSDKEIDNIGMVRDYNKQITELKKEMTCK